MGDLRFLVKLICQQPELIGGNAPSGDTVEQVVKQAQRQAVATDTRYGYSP